MNNIETNVGTLYHTEYLNTNPNVCLLPQHSVIKWDYPNQKLYSLGPRPRWELLDEDIDDWTGDGALQLKYTFN